MRFTRLRLSGFKSFVESTELVIEPGLTGIVGPNGCGKSNLVEALRWVMGETSARRMRGDDMDDVIFGGTAQRPQRNLAEVVLAVDNRERTAPAGLNDSDELEVQRRIERGSGSDYRVNGKLVRARDVQLLFADNASGASSPALVSQGKVAQIIGAKPQERRGLLEEAAGVTGLHSRRHEAELRLRGAEANLTRLDDVIGAMDTQLGALRKQARQAVRYRDLSDRIRKTEAILWHRRWRDAETAEDHARDAFHAAESDVRDRMVLVSRLTTERTEAAAGLPDKRRAEADAAAALQRLVIAREQLDAEEKRIGEEAAALRRRLQQLAGDLGREEALAADAGAALDRLEAERLRLSAESADEVDIEDAAADAVAETLEAVDDLERRLNRLTEEVAALDAQRAAGARRVEELGRRAATLSQRRSEQAGQRDALAARLAGQSDADEAEMAAEAADERLEDARAAAESAETAREAAEQTQAKAREAMQAADAVRARLKAEANALRDLLAADSGDLFPPLIDAVTVAPGLEAALAAALRDDLTAPLDEAAPIHWRALPPVDSTPLPEGVEPLTKGVRGPAAVARALSHIGVVAGEEQGAALAGALRPGQILVSRDGGAWRWDGLTVRPGAPTAAAVRLRQRNRLAELRAELDLAEDAWEDVRDDFDAARRAVEDATTADRRAREVVREAFAAAGAARDHHAKLVREAAAAQSALAALTEAVDRLSADLVEAEFQKAEAETALADLADSREGRERVNEARADLAERRALLAERRSTLDRLRREAEGRRKRLAAIGEETASWTQRSGGAGQRVGELNQRRVDAEAALAVLDGRPADIAQSRQDVLSHIAEAERKRRLAADVLAGEENRLGEAERALKAAESSLSDAREARARAEAAVGAALEAKRTLSERILERLDCRPEDTRAVAGLPPDEPLPEAADTETRLDRLLRERDAMGPVNLRAEIEATELETQIASLTGEREDLIKAIGRLRQAIGNLNREARERLIAAFDIVNRDFQELFTRLFGGGKAYLELVNAEEPLEAGLEIYASPPGKRLQNLSLLSGGEQALTALSLLFAVFRSNPAPICVLDEVDAPLDEANVGRFCDLVEDMAHEDRTRFLVVTHHRLTMARVHRLFGVTMAERGVSQLVSVNLDEAEELAE